MELTTTPTKEQIFDTAVTNTYFGDEVAFNYALSRGDQTGITNALWLLANSLGDPRFTQDERQARYAEALENSRAAIDELVAEAKSHEYAGWSRVAQSRGQKIRYAD